MRAILAAALLLPSLASAQTVTMANISGTITLGGTAQALAAVNPTRRGCMIQNLSAGDLWINDLGTATAAQPSFKVPAGAFYYCGSYGNFAPGAALSIIGATTAQAYAGREW